MALRTIMATGTLALLLAGCGALGIDTGPRSTEEREITDVTAVALETSGDLVVELGDAPSLTVTAGERVLEHLTSEVHDGVLVLGAERRGWDNRGEIDYHLVVTDLEAVHVRGSGDVEADAATAGSLEVVVEGSGDVRIADVDVDALSVRLEGSGVVELAGRATSQEVRLDGSGDYDGRELRGEDVAVAVAGSGDADVHATGSLHASVEGSGSVTHTGGADVESDVQGSGAVRAG